VLRLCAFLACAVIAWAPVRAGEYETKTMGTRRQEGARAVGEGGLSGPQLRARARLISARGSRAVLDNWGLDCKGVCLTVVRMAAQRTQLAGLCRRGRRVRHRAEQGRPRHAPGVPPGGPGGAGAGAEGAAHRQGGQHPRQRQKRAAAPCRPCSRGFNMIRKGKSGHFLHSSRRQYGNCVRYHVALRLSRRSAQR